MIYTASFTTEEAALKAAASYKGKGDVKVIEKGRLWILRIDEPQAVKQIKFR